MFSAQLNATDGTVNYHIVAANLGAIRLEAIFNHSVRRIVSICRDFNVFSAQLNATDGTVNNVIVAANLGTIRLEAIFNHNVRRIVSVCRHYFGFIVTPASATITLVLTLCCTSGSYRLIPCTHVMAKSINIVMLTAQLCTADSTVNYHIVAANISASGFVSVLFHSVRRIVSVCRHYFGFKVITSAAITLVLTLCCTSGCYCLIPLTKTVAKRVYISVNVSITAMAGVRGVTLLGTGGSGHNSIICMHVPIGQNLRIAGHSHVFYISCPINQISILASWCFGRSNDVTVMQCFLLVNLAGFAILENNGVLFRNSRINRMSFKLGCQSSRHAINNAVTVNIPTEEIIRVHCIIGNLINRLTDDLLVSARLHGNDISLLIIESNPGPIITVNHAVSVIPSGEVFIPAKVLLAAFHVNGHTGDVFEQFRIMTQFSQINVLGDDDVLDSDG